MHHLDIVLQCGEDIVHFDYCRVALSLGGLREREVIARDESRHSPVELDPFLFESVLRVFDKLLQFYPVFRG